MDGLRTQGDKFGDEREKKAGGKRERDTAKERKDRIT